MAKQFVDVKFRKGDAKSWCYHNDGEPVAVGDIVKVPTRFGSGWQRAEVVALSISQPPFATKEILGKIAPESSND